MKIRSVSRRSSGIKKWSDGVVGYWSGGVMEWWRMGFHHSITPSLQFCSLRFFLRLDELDQQGNAGVGVIIEAKVNRVKARIVKLELLNVDDEVAGAEMHVVRQDHVQRDGREVGHDRAAIGIDKVESQLVVALVAAEKGDPQSDGALGMYCRQTRRLNRIESAKQIELAVLLGRGVAQNSHLDIHGLTKPRTWGITMEK